MSESTGYENVVCQIGFKGCQKKNAGYSRYKQFAKVGPLLDACETCVRVPYDQPPQFQEKKNEQHMEDAQDPAVVGF